MGFQNCLVCVDTIVGIGTAGLDSGLVGRANGNVEMVLVRFGFGHTVMFKSFLQPLRDGAKIS